MHARARLQAQLPVLHTGTGDGDGLDRNRIVSHSNNDRSRLTTSSRCNRCSASLHSDDLAIRHLSHRTVRAGPRDRLVSSVGRVHSGRQLHARARLQAQLAIAYTGTRDRHRRDRNRLRSVAIYRAHRGGGTIPAHLAGELDARLAGARGLRAGTVGENHTIRAIAQIRNLVLVGAGLRARVVSGQLGHRNAGPRAIVLGRGVVVYVRIHLVPAGGLGGVDHVGDLGLHAGDLDGDAIGLLVCAGGGGDLHRSRLETGDLAGGIHRSYRSVGGGPSHVGSFSCRIRGHISLQLYALSRTEIHGSRAGDLDPGDVDVPPMARLPGIDVAVRIQIVLLEPCLAILVARAFGAIVRIIGRVAVLGVGIRVLDCFAVGTGALHRNSHHFVGLGLGADLDGVSILVGAGLSIGRDVGGVGSLVGAQCDQLGFSRNGALVRICLSGGNLAGTGLVGERSNGLRLHGTGGDFAAGHGDGGAGDLIRVSAVGEFGGLSGEVLLRAVRVRHNHAVLSGGTGIAFHHQAVIVAAVGDTGVLAHHGVAEVVDRHDFRILPQVGAGVAELGVLGERTAAIGISALTAGAVGAAILVRTIEEQAHAVLLRGHAGPAVLDPLIGKLLRDVGLAIGEVIVRFHPVHGLVLGHLAVGGEVTCAEVLELHGIAHLMAVAGVGNAATARGVAVEQVGIVSFTNVGVLKHLTVLVLGAIVQDGVPVVRLLAAEYLIRKLDVLGRVIAEAVGAIGHGLLEQIGHTLGDGVILGVQIPQARKLVLGAVLAVVVVGDLLVLMEVGLVLPLLGDHVEIGREVVGHGIDNDAQAILVGHLAHFLELVFRTDHIVADGHISGLVHVVPVEIPIAGAELAVVLDFDDRLGLDGGITGLGDIRNVLHDGFEGPFKGVQGRTVLHILRQAVLLAGCFERRISHGVGVAVTGGGAGLLRCGRSERKTREQRGGRGKERHGLLAQTSKRC